MGEGDAFGFARGARGEKEEGLVIALGLPEAKKFDEDGGGEEFAKNDPFDDVLFEFGKDAFDENQLTIGRPWEFGDFPNERIGGDEAVEVGLTNRRLHGLAG